MTLTFNLPDDKTSALAAKARATIASPNSAAGALATADAGIGPKHSGMRGDFNWLTGAVVK